MNETSSKQTPCHTAPPREQLRHLVLCCSPLQGSDSLFLLSLPPSVQTYPSPTAALSLRRCCSRTAQPWEKYICHTRQFPALQGQLCGHRDTVICPHTPWNTHFSLPCRYTLCVGLCGLRRAWAVACAAARHGITLSVSEESSWEHQQRAFKAAAETICRRALDTSMGFSSCP